MFSFDFWDGINLKDNPFAVEEVYNENNISQPLIPRSLRAVFLVMFTFAVSTSIYVSIAWNRNEKQKIESETRQLQTEISLLKSQINPHFLFNTLNAIYALANIKSEKTADAIVQLSNMLRYMLYDSDKEKVNIEDELDYIRNYIELQKMRLYDDFPVAFTVTGEPKNKYIAPMLLIPFIENAFKYGVSYSNKNHYINISIDCHKNVINLTVENFYESGVKNNTNSGIGLTNVKRRLELQYANQYMLNTIDENNIYKVDLTLKLI